MAKANIDIGVNIGEAGKSLRTLKQEFKEIQSELDGIVPGTEQYIQTLKKLAATKDQINDLNEEIALLDPGDKAKAFTTLGTSLASGFQAATGAAALFGSEGKKLEEVLVKVQAATALAEGVKGIQDIGRAFELVGTALKANPLLLIATIIAGISAAVIALKDKVKFLGDVFEFVAKPIRAFIQGLKDLGDTLGLTSFAMDELTESIQAQGEAQQKGLDEQLANFDRRIKLLQAQGKSTVDIEIKKQEAIIQTNKVLVQQYEQAVRSGAALTEEQSKQLTAALESIKNASTEIGVIRAKQNADEEKSRQDSYNKFKTDLDKRHQDYLNYLRDLNELRDQIIQDTAKSNLDLVKQFELEKQDEAKKLQEKRDAEIMAELAKEEEILRQKQLQQQREIDAEKAKQDALGYLRQNGLANLATITTALLGNSERAQKAQKAFALGQIAIDSANAVSTMIPAAFRNAKEAARYVPGPAAAVVYGTVLAAGLSAGFATIASNVSKAKALLAPVGGGGGGTNIQGGGIGNVTAVQAPSLNGVGNTSTNLEQLQNQTPQKPVKAVVIQTELQNVNEQVKRIENRSKIE